MIAAYAAEDAERHIEALIDLLIDAVDSGASVGFLPPLARSEALAYWRAVIAAMREERRTLLVSVEGELLQGSVQLDLEMRGNGSHRAEAMKLFVDRRARRRGLAKALMAALENTARSLGRTLLLMDTRKGGRGGEAVRIAGVHTLRRGARLCPQRQRRAARYRFFLLRDETAPFGHGSVPRSVK